MESGKSGLVPAFFFSMNPSVENIVGRIAEIAGPVIEEESAELWGIELLSEARQWVLRVLVETEEGVTLDDCTKIHRQLGDLLDVHDVVPGRYTLEVSSPGINRQLFCREHYERSLGLPVRLETRTTTNKNSIVTGCIANVESIGIEISDGDRGRVVVGWENIARAQLDMPPAKPGPNPNKKIRKKRRRVRKESCRQT